MSLLDTASLVVTPNAYKEGKLYSVIPSDGSGDLSVTRATTATRVNSAGLVELVPYNLAGYSEQFENAYWVKQNTTITANVVTAPNGTLTADRIVSSAGINSYLYRVFSFTIGTTYTLSFYVKASSAQTIRLYGYGNSSDLDVTTEWTRISRTFTATSTSTDIGIRANSSNINFDIYIWGAQLVEGSQAKDYFATETRLNIPRLDYSLGSCPSILVEPQRTNLALWSEQFDNAYWIKIGATISANTTTSPSGAVNADTLIETAITNIHEIYRSPISTVAGTYTLSVYVKNAVGSRFLNVSASDTATNYVSVRFSPSTETLSSVVVAGSFSNGTASFEALDNGWYRVMLTYTCSTTSIPQIALSTDGSNSNVGSFGVQSYLGDGTSGIYLWGAQLEAGAYPTSYIPTTSASVTRNADVISKTGISSLIGQTEGTIYLEADIQKRNQSEFYIAISNGLSLIETIYVWQPTAGNLDILFRTGGVTNTISITTANWSIGFNKIAIAYNTTSGEVFMNGVSKGTVALSALPSCSQLALGSRPDNLGNLVGSGGYKAAALWKERLTNDQLATLTTI